MVAAALARLLGWSGHGSGGDWPVAAEVVGGLWWGAAEVGEWPAATEVGGWGSVGLNR